MEQIKKSVLINSIIFFINGLLKRLRWFRSYRYQITFIKYTSYFFPKINPMILAVTL